MKKQPPRDQWSAIERQADAEEMDRIEALSDEELAKELKAKGLDGALGESAEATVEKLFAWRERQAWRAEARAKATVAKAEFEAHVATRPPTEKLSRDELLARIDRARHDPRLAAPATAMFRNRSVEAASEEELAAILEELEALVERATKK